MLAFGIYFHRYVQNKQAWVRKHSPVYASCSFCFLWHSLSVLSLLFPPLPSSTISSPLLHFIYSILLSFCIAKHIYLHDFFRRTYLFTCHPLPSSILSSPLLHFVYSILLSFCALRNTCTRCFSSYTNIHQNNHATFLFSLFSSPPSPRSMLLRFFLRLWISWWTRPGTTSWAPPGPRASSSLARPGPVRLSTVPLSRC